MKKAKLDQLSRIRRLQKLLKSRQIIKAQKLLIWIYLQRIQNVFELMCIFVLDGFNKKFLKL